MNGIKTNTQYVPEQFPINKGMKGVLIKDLQKELNLVQTGCFDELTEQEIIRLGWPLPLSEEDYKKIVKSEYVKIYEWVIDNINKSIYPYHLDGCLKLVDFFLNRKYKKIKPSEKELAGMCEALHDSITTKRNTMHMQNKRNNKNHS